LVSYPPHRHSSAVHSAAAEADPQSRSAARVIIALGNRRRLIVILVTAVNPVGTTIAFTLATWHWRSFCCLPWLDRWEPEPPRLLLFSFLWGASVAVVLSVA